MSISDYFSAWQFHPAVINSMPAIEISGLPISRLVFIALGILLIFFFKRPKLLSKYILVLWFILSSFAFFQRLFQAEAEFDAYSGYSLEQLRELTTYGGYYGFIESVKNHVPPNEGIMLFLPEAADYFNQKTEYYLYPLRIDQDGRYIAVFHAGSKVDFDENTMTFKYKKTDGKEAALSPVKRIFIYKTGEEIYYFNKQL